MDILSHGLWGGAAFGRKDKKTFWITFFLSMMPDLLSFGILFVDRYLGITVPKTNAAGPPELRSIPGYVYQMYDITHSLLVFSAVFFLVWLILKKPFLPLLGWLLHILVDIPTHSREFFPTPIFWPISDFKFDGISWGDPRIFFPNWAALIMVYGYLGYNKFKNKRSSFAKTFDK